MKIGISGYFGYGNFGDEIFLKTWEQIFNGHEVFALKDETEDLSSFDRIIVGGGDLIIPNFFTNAYWRGHFLQKPTYVYGVGVPNNVIIKVEELDKYKKFLEQCKHITFRDSWSKQFAIENNLCNKSSEVVEDMAWAYNVLNEDMPDIHIDEKTVGISIRPASILNYDNVLELCKYIINEGYNILVIPLQPSDNLDWCDRKHNIKLVDDIKEYRNDAVINIIPKETSIDKVINFMSKLNIFISERMHGAVMSLKSHTNTMIIGKSNKFFRIAEKFDLNNSLCDDNLDNLLKTFRHVESNRNEFNNKIYMIDNIVSKANNELNNFKERVLKGN